jgi:hypothetical protein
MFESKKNATEGKSNGKLNELVDIGWLGNSRFA